VVLHLGTAMLLLATLLTISTGSSPRLRPASAALLLLAFVTVLFGALTANLGAASACGGFPLCNGQVWTTAGPLAVIHWTHRLLAYSLTIVAAIWAVRSRRTGPAVVLLMVGLQISVGATMVLNGLPRVLQATHVAVGAAVWASVVLASLGATKNREAPETKSPGPPADSWEKPVSSSW
jgi:heme A synthase